MMRHATCCVSFVLMAGSARATTVVPADLAELSRDARAIAVGRVASIAPRWIDDRRSIETLVTLDVDRYLKGDLGEALQFRTPGGRIGALRSIMVGAPEFVVGQRVVVFLGARGPSVPHLLGLGQGVYRVVQAAAGWLVTPPVLEAAAAGSTPIVRGDPARRAVALDVFEERVRRLTGGVR